VLILPLLMPMFILLPMFMLQLLMLLPLLPMLMLMLLPLALSTFPPRPALHIPVTDEKAME